MKEQSSKRETKKREVRRAIVKAAAEEFSRRGYKNTSIADIMTAAGLGIGTFYNYFASKEALMAAPLGHLAEEISAAFSETNGGAIKKLEAASAAAATFLAENMFIMPLFLAAAEQYGGSGEDVKDLTAVDPRSGFKALFADTIREGQAVGEIRNDMPATVITEMFHAIYQAAAFSHLDLTFEENVALKTKIILDGIVHKES